ncbi:hypothetical protein ACIZ1P_20755 [Pseudomonas guariconensis]|uniref:hypothetical protein n=1 Tax=Pseudomonas guariconensis TaxID=1288410 RepID=UPI003F68DA97
MARQPVQTKKTETLTLRLDPKMKFAIELLARDQKRTLAGVIEWSIQKSLSRTEVITGSETGNLQQLVDVVWSPDDLEKTIYLGLYAEHLLSYEEQCVWNVLKDNPIFIEIHERDNAGRIKKFLIRKARIAYSRNIITERSEELKESGTFKPITIDEVNEAGGAELNLFEKLAKSIAESKGGTGELEDLTIPISKLSMDKPSQKK